MPFIAGKSDDEREWVSECLSRGNDLDRVDGLDSLVLEDNGVLIRVFDLDDVDVLRVVVSSTFEVGEVLIVRRTATLLSFTELK